LNLENDNNNYKDKNLMGKLIFLGHFLLSKEGMKYYEKDYKLIRSLFKKLDIVQMIFKTEKIDFN